MKFSIIVPAYNAERHLERCLKSLLNQDLPLDEYEIIVVNDGSMDRTGEILDDYSKHFSNLYHLMIENSGVGVARNYGCEKAVGKYFLFVDADDWIKANVLQEIYETLEGDALDVLVMDYRYWECDKEIPKTFNFIPENKSLDAEVFSGLCFMQEFLPQVVWSSAYRATFWKEHNLSFLPIRHEDEEIIPRIFFYAKRVKVLPLKFYNYQKNPDSFMMNYSDNACFYMIQAMESLDIFRQKNVRDDRLDAYFRNLITERLFAAFLRGVQFGVSTKSLYEMISSMKEKKFVLLPKRKGFLHTFLYYHLPLLFIAYYRLKKRRKMW